MDDRYGEISAERDVALSEMYAENNAERDAAWAEFNDAAAVYDYGLWRNTAVCGVAAICVFLAKSHGWLAIPFANATMVAFVAIWIFMTVPLLRQMNVAHAALGARLDAVHAKVHRDLDEIHRQSAAAIDDEYVSLCVLHGEVGWLAARRVVRATRLRN